MPICAVVMLKHAEVIKPKIQEEFPANICLTPSTWLIATEDLPDTYDICRRIGLVMNEEEPEPGSVSAAAKGLERALRKTRGEPQPPNVNQAEKVQPSGYVFYVTGRTGLGPEDINAWLTGR